MPFLTKLFECSQCGTVLDEESGSLLPCSECGATSYRPITDLKEKVILQIDRNLRIKICDELYKKDMQWRQINYSIDKTNDSYEKTVINPETDEVLYHKREALSSHAGRGSAKQKPKDGPKKR
jgi:predicted  nucleic acid-binding Zn-ribbon protein